MVPNSSHSRKRKMEDEKAEDRGEHSSSNDASEDENFSVESDSIVQQKNRMIDLSIALDIHHESIHWTAHTLEKFKNLVVINDWEIPATHVMLNYRDSTKVRKMMLNGGQIPLESGFFTRDEDKLILENWNSFKQEYGFDDPKYFLPGFLPRGIFTDENKRAFVQHLARGLPHRTLRIVYDRFYEIFATENIGRFNYVEDQMILNIRSSTCEYFKECSKLKFLEVLLGRKKTPIFRRSKLLDSEIHQGGFAAPVIWNMELCQKIITALMQRKRVNDISLLENIKISSLDWLCISEKLGINDVYLDIFWNTQLSCLLFAKESISRNKLRYFLIAWFLAHDGIKDWENIPWKYVSESLYTPAFLCYRVFRSMVSTYVPQEFWPYLRDCIDHLNTNYSELFSSNKLKDRYFKRIVFESSR